MDNNLRIVSIWLTNVENKNTSVRSEIKKISERNKERKYKTAVFFSGDKDLVDLTQSLLLHNRYQKST